MTAQVKYSNGWCLVIPKTGFAPMLFMEWLSRFSAGRNWVHKVNDAGEYFSIRLNVKKVEYEEAAEYINANTQHQPRPEK